MERIDNSCIHEIEVVDSQKKLVITLGFGATPDTIDDALTLVEWDEITLRERDNDYICRRSVADRYEGADRLTLEKHLFDLGWRQWKYDMAIWLRPNHKCFANTHGSLKSKKKEE